MLVAQRSSTIMVSTIDLNAARKKLAQRSHEANEKAQRKIEKERILEERKKKREQAIEKELQDKRRAQAEAEAAREQERERLQEINNGVVYWGTLQAVPAPETIALDKGIKRAADKVLLPPSVGRSLLDQGASKNGAYFFDIDNGLGRHTCVGLLEFSSAEGFIALPSKVARCLWGPEADLDECVAGPLQVVYKRLPKGTKVVFQPRSATFQTTIGDSIRDVLEHCLSYHSCLTVGDWVTVEHMGTAYDLRVKELEPESSVSVIDTEMEAEVHPSVETEEKIFQEELKARRLLEERERERKQAQESLEKVQQEKVEYLLKHGESVTAKKSTLPEEPHEEEDDTIFVLFRFPNGEKHQRVFRRSDPVSLLFHFVDAMGANNLMPGTYRLVSQFPRHIIDDTTSKTRLLQDVECFSSGERFTVFLEPCK